eukprot:gene19391-6624_t
MAQGPPPPAPVPFPYTGTAKKFAIGRSTGAQHRNWRKRNFTLDLGAL